MIYMTGWNNTNIAPAISAGPEAEPLVEPKNTRNNSSDKFKIEVKNLLYSDFEPRINQAL